MRVSRKTVGLVFVALLAMAATIGGYYSLPSRAEESPAQTNGPAAETARETRSSVPGDVIEGLVVDERGEPQPGMDVWTADWPGRKATARSGAEGRFRLEVAEPLTSAFRLLASTAEGTRQGILIGEKLGPSKLPLQKVVLKASRTVDIQVVDAGGTPVVGATVESRVLGGLGCYVALEPVATDARGRARLMVPADARLEAIAALKAGAGMGYVCYLMDPAQGQSSPETARLVLHGAMPIGVRVQDSQGKPVAQVKVAPSDFRRKGKDVLSNYFSFHTLRAGAVSDAQGRVQFDWLPADLDRISFSVQHEDYYASGTGLTIKDGGSRNLDVKLLRLARIAGKVIHSDGKAAAGIMIEAEGMGTGGSRCSARTAEDGTYRLKLQPNNSYIVAVADDQWAAASLTGIVLRDGENRQDLDFQLSQGTLIHGTIRVDTESWRSVKTDRGQSVHDLIDDSFGDLMYAPMLQQFGREIPNEWKSLPASSWADDGPDKYRVRLVRMTNVDATGHYAFRVGPGEYGLQVPGFPTKMERLTVTNQREIVVDSEFPKLPPPLRGIVVDRAGKPVPLAFVRYMSGAGQISAVAGKDGRFTLGRYERSAGHVYAGTADAHLAGLRAVAVDQVDVTVVTDKAATVLGRLVDAAGRPLSGMTVRAHFVPPQTPQLSIPVWAKTDREGKYKVSALVPGWQGKMDCYRFPDAEHQLEFFQGPKIVVQSGENNLGDTVCQPANPEPNAPAAERR